MRWLLAAFFVTAGYGHLAFPDSLLAITPDWVPLPRQVIFATGLFEFVASAALLIPRTRKYAAIALAVYSLCVWPANIKHAFEGIDMPSLPSSWWYHGPRLALQPVIIWWALYCGEVIDWPWR
ncbi:MAG: DoxX family protein [Pseudolabrys sp.]